MGLTFEHISVNLGRRAVLSDVWATLAPGRVAVVLGANGAGKTTLLRTAAALVKPAAGKMLLDGEDVIAMSPRDRAIAIGYLPQGGVAHWNIPARDLVALGRLPHRSSIAEDSAAVDEALALTDTEALAYRPVGELSGGERARVLLARALAGRPRWLLADEPLASLDPLHQFETLALLRDVATRGVGVVLVLHDLNQAVRVADDILLLADGKLLAAGDPAQVLNPAMLRIAYSIKVDIVATGQGGPLIVPTGRAGLKI